MKKFIYKIGLFCAIALSLLITNSSSNIKVKAYDDMDNSSYTDSTIYVDSNYSGGALITVPSGKSLIMKNVDFVYSENVSTSVSKVIVVEEGAKLTLNDVDFTNLSGDVGIENNGVLEINDVTFSTSNFTTSIVNNSSNGSLTIRKGVIKNIHLNSGYIVVDKKSSKKDILGVSSNPILITMDNEFVGKKVVVGDGVLASYYLSCFKYNGSFTEGTKSAVLDYVGDNISDLKSIDSKIEEYGLTAGDIILTVPYSYIRNGENIYFATKYGTANYFIEDPKSEISKYKDWQKYDKFAVQYKSGYYTSYRYQDNYTAMVEAGCVFNDETNDGGSYKYILYRSSSITIKYLVGGNEFGEAISCSVLNSTTKAIFIDIPQGYEFSSFSTTGSVSIAQNTVNSMYVRPLVTVSGSGVIGVNLTEVSKTKDVEVSFADGYNVDSNNTITTEYSSKNYASLINPTYEIDGEEISSPFKVYVNGSKVDVMKNAGTYVIKFVDTEDVNYITNEYTFIITQKEVELTYSNLSHVYDKTVKTASASISNGFIVGDSVNVVLSNHEQVNAGTYEVFANLDNSNYVIKDECKTASLFIDKATVDMDNVKFKDVTGVYSGEEYSLLVENLPVDVKAIYDNNNIQTRVGEYSSTVRFELYDIYNFYPLELTSLTARLVITKATINMSDVEFNSITTDYTGSDVVCEITGEYDDVLVTPQYTYYLVNGNDETKLGRHEYPVNVGRYRVVVNFKLSNERDYYAIDDMEAYVVINPKLIVMTGVVFNNLNVTYDGRSYSIEATNIPNEVSVDYTSQEFINAGDYKVTATFSVSNNYKFENNTTSYTLDAYVYIAKKDYDISNIHFDNLSITYDTNIHNIVIDESLLPLGLMVKEYINNEHSDVGVYNASVSFNNSNSNYNDVDDMTAVLTINPKMVGISLDRVKDTYTGNMIEFYPVVTGKLGNDVVNVVLSNSKNVNASVYHARVDSISNSNYTYDKSLVLTYEIEKANKDMSGVSLSNIERVYDGNYYEPKLNGELPEGVTYEMTYSPIKNVGTYLVEVDFNTSSNYYKPTSLSATVVILPKTITMSFVDYENLTYDGQIKSVGVSFTGLVDDNFTGYTITYTPSEVRLAGRYSCVVKLNEYSNYNLLGNNTLDFIVFETKKTYSSSGIDLEITGDMFDPDADFSIKSASLDSKTSVMLNTINSEVKASNMISIDMETEEPLKVSLNADFVDTHNSKYIKVYKINDDVLELVDFEVVNGKLTFETNGDDDFIIVQENGFWVRNIVLVIILSVVIAVSISLSIAIPLLLRKKHK